MSENKKLLAIYDSLPALLDIAREQVEKTGFDIYAIQNKLRKEYRIHRMPFRWSMPYRSLFSCSQCGYMNTVIEHILENPAEDNEPKMHNCVSIWEEDLHQIREHDGAFSKACAAYLNHLKGG